MTLAARPSRLPRWLLPSLLAAALLLMAVAAALLARRGRDQAPPVAGPFTPPGPARPALALDVQQARGGDFTLGGPGGTVAAAPAAGAAIILAQPATTVDVAAGDWLTIVGVPNEIYNFAIRQAVIIPAALGATPDADGIPRLTGGFAGHEANRDARERPLLAGRVERTAGGTLVIAGPAGPVTLDVAQPGLLYRLGAASAAEIREGDRVAFFPPRPAAGLGDAGAVLVLRGGQ